MARTKGARNADYDVKRRELLARLLPRFVDRDQGRPSFRQFAAAAGVTMPTLRHYFGDRSDLVGAVLEEYRRLGETRLQTVATPAGDFAGSIRDFAHGLVIGLQAPGGPAASTPAPSTPAPSAPPPGKPARLGDVFSASLSEGLADPEISPLALRYVFDPAVEALERRLGAHLARGEMRKVDLHAAALTLIAPLLLAVLHQDQLQGADVRPVALHALADEVAEAFIRAYAA